MSEVPSRTSHEAPESSSTPRPDDESQLWAGNWEEEPTTDEGPEDHPEVTSPEPEPDTSRSILEGGVGTRSSMLETLKAESEAADALEAIKIHREREESRREAEEAKRVEDKNAFEDSLYGEPLQAPGPDATAEEKAKFFAPERMKRFAEADAYEAHLAKMADPNYRSSALDGNDDKGNENGSSRSQLETGKQVNVSIDGDVNYHDEKEYSGADADLLKRMDKYAAAANELREAAHVAEESGDTDKAQELMREYEKADRNFGLLQRKQERDASKREEEKSKADHAALIARSAALPPVPDDGPEVPAWMDEEGPHDPGTDAASSAGAPEIDWGGEPPVADEDAPEDDGSNGGTGSGTPAPSPTPPTPPARTPASSSPASVPDMSGYAPRPAGGRPSRIGGATLYPDADPAWARVPSPEPIRVGLPSPDSVLPIDTGSPYSLDPWDLPVRTGSDPRTPAATPESTGAGSVPIPVWLRAPDTSASTPSTPEASTPSSVDPDHDSRRFDPDHDRDDDRGDSFEELGLFGWASSRFSRLFGGERGRAPRLDSEPESESSEKLGSRGRTIVAVGTLGVMAMGLFTGIGSMGGGEAPQRAVPVATAEGPQRGDSQGSTETPSDNGSNDNDTVTERPVANAEQGYTVSQGEGFLSLLSKEGIPVERQAGAMQKILDLADKNPQVGQWVYQRRIGEPGIAKTGVMPPNVLKLIKNVAK